MPAIVRIIEDGVATIPDGSITENKLANNSVGTPEIINDAVTADKIAAGAVGETELAANAVTQAKIADGAVGEAEIIDESVTNAKLAGSILPTKITGTAVVQTRTITTGIGLTGGGDLSTNLTLSALMPWASFGPKPAANVYVSAPSNGVVSAGVGSVGTLNAATPVYLWAGEIDRIGISILTAANPGVLRLGIYSANATTGRPETLLLDAGTVDATTTGEKELTISQTISTSGWYWLVVVPQNNTGTINVGCITGGSGSFQQTSLSLANSLSGTFARHGWIHSGAVTGALPATFNPVNGGNICPRLAVRYLSVA